MGAELGSNGRRGAVVTGGAGGLGQALARQLLARGLRVWLADVDEPAAVAAAATLGGDCVGVALDVTDAGACRRLAHEVERTDGLAVWVNNAGLLRAGPAWSLPGDQVRALFDVNVHGTMHGTEAALEVLRPADAGHVLNVVSLAGLVAPPGEVTYAATKHAVLAYTLGTAQDLRLAKVRGIQVTAVCPDGIWTPMLHREVDDPQAAVSFQGGLLDAEQVAVAAAAALERRALVVSVPRWRGGLARTMATFPRLARAVAPLIVWHGRWNQRRARRRGR